MPEDNKPRENKFLEQNQAAQFVKSSTDMLSNKVGGFFQNTAKAYTVHTNVQIESGETLKRIDSTLRIIRNTLLQQNTLMEKNNAETLRLQIQTKKFVSEAATKKVAQKKTAKDFVRRQDPDEGMRKNILDIENILRGIRGDANKRKKKKTSAIWSLLKTFGIGGLIGYLLTGKGEYVTELRENLKNTFSKIWGGITEWYTEGGGKEMLANTGKAIATGIFDAVKFTAETIWNNKEKIGEFLWDNKAIVGGGLLAVLLTGNVGRLASIVTSVGGAIFNILKFSVISALKFAFSNPAVVGVIGASVFTAVQLKKLTDAIVDGVKSRKESEKVKSEVIKSGKSFASKQIDRLNFDENSKKKYMENQKALNLISRVMADDTGVGADYLFETYKHLPFMEKWKKKRSFLFGFSNEDQIKMTEEALRYFNEQKRDIIKANKQKSDESKKGSTSKYMRDKYKKGSTSKYMRDKYKKADNGGDKVPTSKYKGGFTTGMFRFGDDGKVMFNDEYYSALTESGIGFDYSTETSRYPGLYLHQNSNIDGLQPNMKKSLLAMAREYYNITGDTIQINSAKRNKGGKSIHDYGWAIDMQSVDADALEKLGLMKKYGFHRPLINFRNPQGKKETWHVEPYLGEKYGPRDTNNVEMRRKAFAKKKQPESGGDVFYNLPQGTIESVAKSEKPIQVVLSDNDIEKLIIGFGDQMKINRAPEAPISNTQMVSGRRL